MNHKRGRPRSQVRCSLCTDARENIGGDRRRRERDAVAANSPRVSNGRFYDWCPECGGTGRCNCGDCDGVCVLCGGSKIYDFTRPRAGRVGRRTSDPTLEASV